MPVVAISAHGNEPNVTHIVLDHVRAVEMALKHSMSWDTGGLHSCVGPKVIPDSDFRWEGVQVAAQALGLDLDSDLITRIDSGSWSLKTGHHPMSPEIGYEPMKQLLEKTQAFTAVFCFNDIAAIGAIRALTEAGLRVPP